MSESPIISVIVPVYNAGEFLIPMLKSILNQSLRDFEVICIDDGSTDDSFIKLEAAARRDERMVVLRQEQKGPGCARNLGLDVAKGTYVSFVDADDIIHPKMLEKAYEAATENDADIVVFQMEQLNMETGQTDLSPDAWDEKGLPSVLSRADIPNKLYSTFKNWPCDKLFNRNFLKVNSIRFPSLRRTEDLPFTCKALTLAKRIVPLNQVLYTYRVMNPSSSTQNLDRAPLDFISACKLFKEFLDEANLFEQMKIGYLNWTALCILVNLFGMKTLNGFRTAYSMLHDGALDELGFLQCPSDLFEDDRYNQVLDVIRECPTDEGAFEFWRLDRLWQKQIEPLGLKDHLYQSIAWRINKLRNKMN